MYGYPCRFSKAAIEELGELRSPQSGTVNVSKGYWFKREVPQAPRPGRIIADADYQTMDTRFGTCCLAFWAPMAKESFVSVIAH
ncbi:hypothetical protein GCM10010353_73030 [Streptomyces chryseus]|nr:hypothetical protein GCM10010353_73030 [Streptomyces chryseus]